MNRFNGRGHAAVIAEESTSEHELIQLICAIDKYILDTCKSL